MRPARMPSSQVKVMPWYYTERNQPSRKVDKAHAVAYESAADDDA